MTEKQTASEEMIRDLGLIRLYNMFSQDQYSAKWMGGLEEGTESKQAVEFKEWLEEGRHLEFTEWYYGEDLPTLRAIWESIVQQDSNE